MRWMPNSLLTSRPSLNATQAQSIKQLGQRDRNWDIGYTEIRRHVSIDGVSMLVKDVGGQIYESTYVTLTLIKSNTKSSLKA